MKRTAKQSARNQTNQSTAQTRTSKPKGRKISKLPADAVSISVTTTNPAELLTRLTEEVGSALRTIERQEPCLRNISISGQCSAVDVVGLTPGKCWAQVDFVPVSEPKARTFPVGERVSGDALLDIPIGTPVALVRSPVTRRDAMGVRGVVTEPFGGWPFCVAYGTGPFSRQVVNEGMLDHTTVEILSPTPKTEAAPANAVGSPAPDLPPLRVGTRVKAKKSFHGGMALAGQVGAVGEVSQTYPLVVRFDRWPDMFFEARQEELEIMPTPETKSQVTASKPDMKVGDLVRGKELLDIPIGAAAKVVSCACFSSDLAGRVGTRVHSVVEPFVMRFVPTKVGERMFDQYNDPNNQSEPSPIVQIVTLPGNIPDAPRAEHVGDPIVAAFEQLAEALQLW